VEFASRGVKNVTKLKMLKAKFNKKGTNFFWNILICNLESFTNTCIYTCRLNVENNKILLVSRRNDFGKIVLGERNFCGTSHGILSHVANIDNRSATGLIYKCSLLCNNIPIATHTRNSTVPSLLWYDLVNSAQQRTAFFNDPTGILYRVRLKTSRERYVEDASVSKTTWTSSDREQQARSSRLECH
jgi:hypothetical protein